MFVKLLNEPNEKLAGIAAAICVDKYDFMLSYCQNRQYDLNREAAVKSNHLSVLEHITFTFYIDKVSRALSHQLVRHQFGVAV